MIIGFNESRADKVIKFIQSLTITIGDKAGQRFLLHDFQKDFIRKVYGPIDQARPANRLVRRAVLSLARKNGKSELAAALILVHLIGPECEMNGEIYSAANDREQAAIVFNAVKRMVEAEPELQKYLTIVSATKRIYVHRSDCKARGSKFVALSAEAGTKHGLNPSLIVFDELAQAKNRELLDTLATSQGARADPLFLTISTQSHDPLHPLSQMIDDGLRGEDPTIVVDLHAADDGCDLMDEAQWAKANPGLGKFRSLDELRNMAMRAARMPSEEQAFRLLYLNQRVSNQASLITRADWEKCDAGRRYEFELGEAIYLGLDLSGRMDLTALVAVSAERGSRVKSWFWKPKDYLHEHSTRDRFRYDLMANEQWLSTCDGRSIDPLAVAMKVAELSRLYDIRGLAYDRWRVDELLRCFDQIGFEAQEGAGPGLRIEKWGQGFGDMAPALDAFEAAVLQEELKHDGNPVMTFCVMNAQAISDPAGNRKLAKDKSRFRIDGAVSLAMALGLKAKDRVAEEASNPWEAKDFEIEMI